MNKIDLRLALTLGAVGVFMSALVGCMGVGESTSSSPTSALQAGKHAGPVGTGVTCGDDEKQGIDDEKDTDDSDEVANDDKDDQDSADVNGCDNDDNSNDDKDVSDHDDGDDLDKDVAGGGKDADDTDDDEVVVKAP